MVKLKVIFFVPPGLAPPNILLRVQSLCSQLDRSFRNFKGCTLVPASHLMVQESTADGDTRIEFELSSGCGHHLSNFKQMLCNVGDRWLKVGVTLRLIEPCPDCNEGTLVRVNQRHEYCENCEQTFEDRPPVTESEDDEQSEHEQKED